MRDTLKSTVVFTVIAAIIFGLYLGGSFVYEADTVKGAEVHFIDVGQGDSVLIRCGDKNMLIDGATDYGGDAVISYIEKQGIKTLDIIVATHPHDDHIGGLDEVIEMFGVDKIYMPDAYAATDTFTEFLDAADKATVVFPESGDTFSLGDADFTVIGPNNTVYNNLNNYSLCLRMTYGLNSFVFTGDAEAMAEREMISKGYELMSDVLKAGHHGSKTASCEEFTEAVHPAISVVSVGEGNSYGLPDEEALERLGKYSRIYRTDVNGNIVVVSDGENLEVHYDYN